MMEIFLKIIDAWKEIILKIIDKFNIIYLMLILVIVGLMNQKEVFVWFDHIAKAFKGILP